MSKLTLSVVLSMPLLLMPLLGSANQTLSLDNPLQRTDLISVHNTPNLGTEYAYWYRWHHWNYNRGYYWHRGYHYHYHYHYHWHRG